MIIGEPTPGSRSIAFKLVKKYHTDEVAQDLLSWTEVPLSDQAIAVLEQLPRIKNKVGLVFTTNANTPVSGFTRAKDRLDVAIVRAMRDAAEEDGDDWNEVDGLAPWTLHDLRRTAATGMAHVDPTPG